MVRAEFQWFLKFFKHSVYPKGQWISKGHLDSPHIPKKNNWILYIFLHFGAWEKVKFLFEIYWPLLFAQLQHSSSWSTLSFRSLISLVLFAINSMSQRTSDFLGSPNALFILWSNLGTLCSWLKPVRTAKRTKKGNITLALDNSVQEAYTKCLAVHILKF